MTSKKIVMGAVLFVLIAGALLVLDIDYDRYADRLSNSIEAVTIEFDNSPKIPLFLGCDDLMDKRLFMSDQYNTIYADTPAGEMSWFFEDIEELNKQYTENNCTGNFINGEIVK